ncbi:hypothetical protein B7P43_G17355 [Cryptotermes secundus]|uniref:Uncharacterized protein n=1 Tax=Cryptotermes secundus TaxID=105785 RepID=A0A2J7Q7Y9_9NEOP|nr:hypothetical protein B7P43_G17355 [Cryptotermes secundus]
MDEIEYKLKKSNAILVVNAISKLVKAIKSKGAPHSGKIEELPELIFLKERCEDADPVINITACQGVITLVETGVLAVIPTLSGFIAALPTVRNYTGVISSIGALLIIDLKARLSENGSFQCPFNLRSPQHPLISVLKQNKDTWCDVFNIMQFICGHNEEM